MREEEFQDKEINEQNRKWKRRKNPPTLKKNLSNWNPPAPHYAHTLWEVLESVQLSLITIQKVQHMSDSVLFSCHTNGNHSSETCRYQWVMALGGLSQVSDSGIRGVKSKESIYSLFPNSSLATKHRHLSRSRMPFPLSLMVTQWHGGYSIYSVQVSSPKPSPSMHRVSYFSSKSSTSLGFILMWGINFLSPKWLSSCRNT